MENKIFGTVDRVIIRGTHVDVVDFKFGRGEIDDAEINDGVDAYRDVVSGDNVLRRYVHNDDTQIDLGHLLQAGNQDDQARALDRLEATEKEHDAALIFLEDLESVVGDNDYDRCNQPD